MDPFSALGLASNIIQLIDFGSRLVSKSQELYQSADGSGEVNRDLEAITTDLNAVCTSLLRPERYVNKDIASGPELALLSLCTSCKELGNELLGLLQTLKVKGRKNRYNTARQALRSICKESKILAYEKRLDQYRSQIAIHVTNMLSEELLHNRSTIAKALNEMAATHRRLELTSTNEATRLRRDILESVKKIRYHQYSHPRSEREALANLPILLSALPEEVNTHAKNLSIIQSLHFASLSDRESRVREAHPATFNWLFEDDEIRFSNRGSTMTSIIDWLKIQNGIFWISGKAGSGKSTLMKFIYNHEKTLEALHTWAGEKRLFTAGFFFWHAGTEMQKSQLGLLQSLLYHVLRQCPSLIKEICPSQWHQANATSIVWDRRELLNAFNKLRYQSVDSARFCFFIDGLDEYAGEHSELIELMDSFSSSTDIKICVASRPWNVFEEAYGEKLSRKIRLQDLTQHDIERFVTDELGRHHLFSKLRATDNRCEDLIMEIVHRADGVFLWVFLVVQSLGRGLTNEDTVPELLERLRILPTDLEVFFRHMLDSVEKVYHKSAARLFLMRLSVQDRLEVMTTFYFHEEDLNYALAVYWGRTSATEWEQQQMRNRARVKARCVDLLEISSDGDYVEYLHKTVFDYLETPKILQLLDERAGADFQVHRHMCNAMLCNFMHLPSHVQIKKGIEPDRYIRGFIYHARQYESGIDSLDGRLVEKLGWAVESRLGPWGGLMVGWENLPLSHYSVVWITAAAIQNGLHRWVRDNVKRVQLLIDKAREDLNPLLLALQLNHGRAAWPTCHRFVDSRIVGQLLDQGADPNEKEPEGQPIWLAFLKNVFDKCVETVGASQRENIKVLEMLFLHGAMDTQGCDAGPLLAEICAPEEAAYLQSLLAASKKPPPCPSQVEKPPKSKSGFRERLFSRR